MHEKDSPSDEDSYFLVKVDYCLKHQEPQIQTIH